MMDTFIQKAFKFFGIIFAFPFKLQWEPSFTTKLTQKPKSLQNILWHLTGYLSLAHFIVTVYLFSEKLPEYVHLKHYDKLAFHSAWMLFLFSFVNQDGTILRNPKEVMQLSNGLVQLVKNLERGNPYLY